MATKKALPEIPAGETFVLPELVVTEKSTPDEMADAVVADYIALQAKSHSALAVTPRGERSTLLFHILAGLAATGRYG